MPFGSASTTSPRVLGTVMGNTSPNHNSNSYYRNPTFYYIVTLDPLCLIASTQLLFSHDLVNTYSLVYSEPKRPWTLKCKATWKSERVQGFLQSVADESPACVYRIQETQ